VACAADERSHLDDYARQLMDPTTGIALSTRRVRMHTYNNVFSGSDAAGWFMANMEGVYDLTAAQQVGTVAILYNTWPLTHPIVCRWGSS
jgi:hypothetical protein